MVNGRGLRRPRGRWLVLLVVVPVVAALVAGWRASGGSYTAAARVPVAEILAGDGASGDEVDQLVARFVTAFEDSGTADDAATAIGVPADEVRGSLAAEAVAGSLVEVTHRSGDESDASAVLDAATRSSLAQMVQERRDRAAAQAVQAAARTDRLAASLAEVQAAAGAVDVARSFDLLTGDVLQLRNDIATAQVTNLELARSLVALLEAKQLELDRLGGSLVEFRRLDSALTAAIADENVAQAEVDTLDQQLAAVGAMPVLLRTEVSSTPELARAATLAIVAAAVAALVVLLLYVVGGRDTPSERAPSAATADEPVPVEAAAAP